MLARAKERLGTSGTRTILFLDEIHRFNKAQQDALLPGVESGLADPDRRDDREPVLRGQLRAHLPHAGLRARVADAGGDGGRRPARARRGRRRGARRGRRADRAALRRRRAHGAQHRRDRRRDRRRPRSPSRTSRTPRASRRSSTTRPATSTTTSRPPSSSRCAAAIPTRRSTTSPRCSRRRGRALHRAADDRARLRGHRQRRPARAARRGRGGAGGRARRPARGAPQPLPGGDLPRARAEVERELRRAQPRDARTCRSAARPAAEGPARRLVVRPPARARRGLHLSAQRPARASR